MSRLCFSIVRRTVLIAALLALCLVLLFPMVASAHTDHAILLRSDPAKDAILSTAPQQVRMWFSEDLNPALSTAVVVNADNQRVDNNDAHVSSSDTTEMDVTLKSNLQAAVYIVVWRSDSNEDGHILRGSFIFTVARPDGTVPTLNGNTIPGQNALGGGNLAGLYTGQIDGPTLFNLVVITLVELGAVFWVGAQLWCVFVLQPVTEDHKEQRLTNQQVQQRFEQRFSLPTLLILLLANVGVLLGQALNFTGGQWGAAFTPTLLTNLATSGRFGAFWMMREIVIGVAIVLALYIFFANRARSSHTRRGVMERAKRPRRQSGGLPVVLRSAFQILAPTVLPWVNMILGLALFIAIAMSSHAAAVSKNLVIYAVPIDWLHLLAAAFWVGGMMYIATTYLPVIRHSSIKEQARSLITVLPYYTPWATGAVVAIAITGPFSATFHLTSWAQYVTTAYGRALAVKILLVGALLISSAIHIGLLRPRVKKEYQKYAYAASRLGTGASTDALSTGVINHAPAQSGQPAKLLTQQVKLREGRLSSKTRRLTGVLRWEPLLGVGVLVCVGLMNVFGGTLSPTAAQQPTTANVKPFNTVVKTTDNKFTVTFNVNPNRFGTNIFTVSVVDNSTGKPTTNIGVSLYTTMLDMDMGTDTVNLLPDGKGHFTASGDLSMGGNWQIRIQIRTPNSTLSEANVKFFVPV